MQVTILSPSATGFPAVSLVIFLPMATISPVPSWPRTTGQRRRGPGCIRGRPFRKRRGFHLDQHFIVSDGGNGIFTDFKCLWCCQDSGACGLLHDVLTLSLAARILQEQIVMKGTPPVENGRNFLPGPSCNTPWRRMSMIPGNMESPVLLLYGFPEKEKNHCLTREKR